MMKDTPEIRALAQMAARQASRALPQLMEVSLEGPSHYHHIFEDEAIEQLADALKMAIEASIEAGERLDSERGQLLGACRNYLEGWAG